VPPPSSQGNCVGTDTFLSAAKLVAPRLATAKKHKKTKILTLGKGTFSIPPGKTAKVTIKLNNTALKLLAKKHTLKAKQKVVSHDSRNNPVTTTAAVKLKLAKKKKS